MGRVVYSSIQYSVLGWNVYSISGLLLAGGTNVSHTFRNIVCFSNTKVIIACDGSENEFVSFGWLHENGKTSPPHALYNNTGSNVSTNYLMIMTPNGESLVIDSVRLRDAGVYYCTMITVTGESNEVGGHLIVLGECELLLWQSWKSKPEDLCPVIPDIVT